MEQHAGALAESIRQEISARGPISFARFMDRALLDPGLGYYVGTRVRAGASGDFMTAPELHPLLGAALARLAVSTWERLDRPTPFRWTEFGAGSGTLLLAALRYLAREKSPLLEALEIQAIEANPHRRRELLDAAANLAITPAPRLIEASSDAALETTSTTESVADVIVVANEFLDALPVHIVVGRRNAPSGFLERRVGVDAESGAFIVIV